MKASITLAADAPYFAGHFPGNPILPGVVEVALMVEAATHLAGRDAPLHTIPFARLRHVVVPGDRLELGVRNAADGRIRVDVTRAGTVVANAALELGALRPALAAGLRPDMQPPADVPPPAALLPQQPPMRFVTAIVGEAADGLACTARVPASCALVNDGVAPAFAAIEAAAQTAAAWEALRRWRAGGDASPRRGYLVALRDVVLFATAVPAEADLVASIRLAAAAPPLTHYAVEVEHGPQRVLRGTIATVLTAP